MKVYISYCFCKAELYFPGRKKIEDTFPLRSLFKQYQMLLENKRLCFQARFVWIVRYISI